MILLEVRGIKISYASYKKKIQNETEQNLLKEIEEIEQNNPGVINYQQLEEKKNELENLRKEKLKGSIIRSKAKWVEEGEKPSKYFCNMESRNFVNKTIKKRLNPELLPIADSLHTGDTLGVVTASFTYVQTHFNDFISMITSRGWLTDPVLLGPDEWRCTWNRGHLSIKKEL
ncbi:hypothetical protein FSP39_001222 [Pinctada imbricata]|uniref:Root UVB sensitive protein C-terminal domain-containing protein n=1 Tax=Pinctada imbricata TaxID=66713 RepID=A0AA88XM41_PINIB|nr:hypothetical protein FSP39_001222 [Pinctada imbricata]